MNLYNIPTFIGFLICFFILFTYLPFLHEPHFQTGPAFNFSANKEPDSISNNNSLHNTARNAQTMVPKKVTYVLLLSSVGRSGSTLMAEILRTHQKSVLFYEPGLYLEKESCFKLGNCFNDLLQSIFQCLFSNNFIKWYMKTTMFSKFTTSEIRNCLKNASHCFTKYPLKELCQKSEVRIIKVIRARIVNMGKLLKNPDIHVKIVHLARDPRGTATSMTNLKNWKIDNYDICHNLESDLIAFESLRVIYPKQLINITYEGLSRNPISTISIIFKFIFGYDKLPLETVAYINRHMLTETSGSGTFNTIRNSTANFQKWRWEISEDVFLKYQSLGSCENSLKILGYRVFKNFDQLKDASVSLFMDENRYV